jgi:glycosyltransferase involved in cell wall biosynthesis
MEDPLVSVIITTYNRPNLLPRAIKSVIDQNYSNLEVIVVNDNGTDVKYIVDSFNDNRIVYINKSINAGLGAARNSGLNVANGKYVNFLDDDDGYYYYHIKTLVDFLQKNNYKIAYTDCLCKVLQKNEQGNDQIVQQIIVYSIDYNLDVLLFQNIVPVLGVMFELDEKTRNIRHNEVYHAYEDWDFWLQLTRFYDMHHLDIPTCWYTFRNDGTTMSSSRNDFTTLLPGIYKENYKRAKNQAWVCSVMNQILQSRNLQPMFKITNS